MDEAEQIDFIGAVCNNFADSLNTSSDARLCGQDSYEVLSLVFGDRFTPQLLRGATPEQMRDLSMAVWELLETKVSPEAVSVALTHALDTAGFG